MLFDPGVLKKIESDAFSGCTALTDITIYKSVTNIGSGAFADCSESLCITCYENSAAHSYAVSNSIDYELIDVIPIGNTRLDSTGKTIISTKPRTSLLSDILTLPAKISAQVSCAGRLLGTGAIVKLFDAHGRALESYTYILAGDLNGDGTVDALDAVMSQYASDDGRSYTPSGAFFTAGDINGDGVIDETDCEAVLGISVS